MSRDIDAWIQAELYVLGALISKPSVGLELELSAEHFSQDDLRQVFETIQQLQMHAEAIDVLTVADRLEQQTGRSWLALVGNLVKQTWSVANVPAYARMLRDAYRKRRSELIASALQENSELPDAVDTAIRDLMSLSVSGKTFEVTGQMAVQRAIEYADDAANGITGLPTGLADLDYNLGGLHKGDLVIIGARPGVGKTAFLINLVMKSTGRCGVISSEQGHGQIGQRMLGIAAEVSVHNMRTGHLSTADWDRIASQGDMAVAKRLWLNDRPGISISEVQRQARKWKFERDIQCLYVDYLQRIKGTQRAAKRMDQVAEVVEGLKELARELDIPIVVLAQLNRNAAGKLPGINDLAESGVIEREADQILLLYREDEISGRVMDVFVGKNRHGPMGKISLAWNPDFMRLDNLDMRHH